MSTVMLTKNTACLIERMTEHAKADEIIKGTGWDGGKGCFVGCALHEYNYSKFPEGLGWPTELGYLCDGIFEGLSNGDAKQFAVDVPNAVGVDGKDLSMVLPHFLFWLLADPVEGVIRFVPADKFPQQHKAVSDVAELRRRQIAGETITAAAWAAAWDAAARKQQAAKLIELLKAAPVVAVAVTSLPDSVTGDLE